MRNLQILLRVLAERAIVSFPVLAGLYAFCFYFVGLAPGITFEDSGELVTAAYHLGIPHPPGYPLNTMLGALFVRIPGLTPAYAMNLMSAVFSAVSVALLAAAIRQLVLATLRLERFKDLGAEFFVGSVSALAAALVGVGPYFYRQAVITEVYGLNNLLSAAMILVLARWYRTRRDSWLVGFCFLLGLGMTNHHTAWMFFPFALLLVGAVDKRKILSPKLIVLGFSAFAVGLLPYLYLPLASRAQPLLDWGNPETWREFWLTITRFQYRRSFERPAFVTIEQLRQQVIFLLDSLPLAALFLGALGLSVLASLNRAWFAALAGLLILSGPITAWLTNFAIPFGDAFNFEDVTSMVSVFYLPHYQAWGLAIGVGTAILGFEIFGRYGHRSKKIHWAPAAVLIFAAIFVGFRTHAQEKKNRYDFAEQMFRNWETLAAGKPALVLNNWDPFSFPPIYYQLVEKRAPNIYFVDIEMLKAPWYVHALERWYPGLMKKVEKEKKAYLDAIEAVTEGKSAYTGNMGDLYVALVNAIADRGYEQMPVFLAVPRLNRSLYAGQLEQFEKKSVLVASQLVKNDAPTVEVDPSSFDISGFDLPEVERDRLAKMMAGFYGVNFADRAADLRLDDPREARKLLLVGKALARYDSRLKGMVDEMEGGLNKSRVPASVFEK